MYCIVNSIDPLDLKEDGNVSDCSDSWELLDYEKETNDNSNEQKQPLNTPKQAEKSTYGDHESQQVANASGSNEKKVGKTKGGQKQTVSFAIPDLVKEKQTIELTKQNETVSEQVGSKTGCKIKQDSSKHDLIIESQTSKSGPKVGATSSLKQKKKEDAENNVWPVGLTDKAQPKASRAPVLNYAAALAAKLDNDTGNRLQGARAPSDETQSSAIAFELDAPQSKGVTKRNRPMSSSSWSSCDDEIIAEVNEWDHDEGDKDIALKNANDKSGSIDISANNNNNNDDLESIFSGGFSDFDYGFGGINDYVMRPKRSQTKRRRNVSANSNSSLTAMAKRGNEREVQSSNKRNDQPSVAAKEGSISNKETVVCKPAKPARNSKPKKKKLGLSSPSVKTQSDFIKKQSESSGPQLVEKTNSSDQNAPNGSTRSSSGAHTSGKINEPQLMGPPTLTMPTSSTSGNDSSDIPDMDESWYLTPPPCFTGAAANTLCIIPKPKAREAARENLLIEHPSIYIASTSKQLSSVSKRSTKELLSKEKTIVLKKLNSKQVPPSSDIASSEDAKKKLGTKVITAAAATTTTTTTTTRAEGEKSAKCWGNKFVVTDWDDFDQGELNDDFDNLFPTLKRQQSVSSKKSAIREKTKQTSRDKTKKPEKKSNSDKLIPIGSASIDGYESDFSIPSPSSLQKIVEDQAPASEEKSDPIDVVGRDCENAEPKGRRRNKSGSADLKVPVKVDPIEPERQPGWQLKKKRSKRRPLVNLTTVGPSVLSSKQQPVSGAPNKHPPSPAFSPYGELSYAGSSECSARSTPTLITRIGSSIVANLSNLTSGFASSTGMNIQASGPMSEINGKMNRIGLMRDFENGEQRLRARRHMSKALLNRQNNCSKVAKSSRQPDRRAKMRTTPNGISVNRKVHTKFH